MSEGATPPGSTGRAATAGPVRSGVRPLAPVDAAYHAVLRSTAELLAGRPGVAGVTVAATPGWTVHDVLRHVVVRSGRPVRRSSGPWPAQTGPVRCWPRRRRP